MAAARIAALLVVVAGLSACATAGGFIQDSQAVGSAVADELDD
ncbi:hypothetical protein [Jannaschia donghaensis]|uniref:Small secreted protein n=1 Tax=Jannaschia donghaensis TaxID=420998 RepID=A0A0M6YFM0_9RHOB|nr:hypothetical protein [Jannaschia donghaensis]CTQ48303.1 hypothetical protein JDO7802_00305 [Jannaschia donghaensis]